jgi:hypothetical protein
MSRMSCHHRHVVCLHGDYPEMAKCWTSCSYARMPAWGRLYMHLLISTNITCPLCTYARRLYCSMIDCGMTERGMCMYSYRDMGSLSRNH